MMSLCTFVINSSLTIDSMLAEDIIENKIDFWKEIFEPQWMKYGLISFITLTLVCLIPFYTLYITYIGKKHFR